MHPFLGVESELGLKPRGNLMALSQKQEQEFRLLYIQQKLPGRLVAEKMGLPMCQIYRLKRKLVVATVPKWGRRNVPSLDETPLRSILLGSMLGDGSISPITESIGGYQYSEYHAEAQRGYIEWKHSVWGHREQNGWAGNITRIPPHLMHHPDPLDLRVYQSNAQYGFHTITHGDLSPWWEVFYRNADIGAAGQRLKKFTAAGVLDLVDGVSGLDDTALAVWYADDGHAGHWPQFCVGDRNKKEAGILLQAWGLEPSEYPNGWEIRDPEQVEVFMERVSPVVLHNPDMHYKLFDVGSRYTKACQPVFVQAPLFSKEDKDLVRARVVSLGRGGMSATEIATCTGKSRDTVVRLLVAAGLQPIRARRPLPDTLAQRAVAGEPVQHLAKEFGWDPNTLYRRLDEKGIAHRSRGGHPPGTLLCVIPGAQTAEELKQSLLKEKGSVLAVATKLGCGVSTLRGRIQIWDLWEHVVIQKRGKYKKHPRP